jgi:hypothetical protein
MDSFSTADVVSLNRSRRPLLGWRHFPRIHLSDKELQEAVHRGARFAQAVAFVSHDGQANLGA